METHTAIVLFALVAAFGLVTVVAVDIILTAQEAEAKGCVNPNAPGGGSIAVNASKGRCIQ
jgi:Flp pilus assembly protein CpaB